MKYFLQTNLLLHPLNHPIHRPRIKKQRIPLLPHQTIIPLNLRLIRHLLQTTRTDKLPHESGIVGEELVGVDGAGE